MLTVVPDLPAALAVDGASSSLIDQIVRKGARQMQAAALQAEVAAYISPPCGCGPTQRRPGEDAPARGR